jgi:regulator of sigma E protease
MSVLYSILAFYIVLGIIVIVHEFGHYIAARLMGVRVETFSFGFGKRIFGKQIGDTDFRLSLIPLGGYVKMAGEEEWDPDNIKPDDFQGKNRGQKIFILVMGPIMNLLLAFLIYTIVNITGVQELAYKAEPPIIGFVEKGSPAENVGIQVGDLVRTINGSEIRNWKGLEFAVGANPNEKVDIQVEREGEILSMKMEINSITQFHLGDAGIQYGFRTKVAGVTKGEPAEAAGVKADDVIIAINDKPVTYQEISDTINGSQGQMLKFTISRDKEQRNLDVTPKKVFLLESKPLETVEETREMLKNARSGLPELTFEAYRKDGKFRVFSKNLDSEEELEKFSKMSTLELSKGSRWIVGIAMVEFSSLLKKHYAFFPAMGKGVKDLYDLTLLVFKAFKKMIVGKLSPKNLSGPIEIAKFSSKAMKSGPTNFFLLIAFISLQLGIVNLFPIPALDGGHLMIYSIEAIIRRDFSAKVKNVLMNMGFFLLIGLMVFVILNDIAKTLPNGWSSFLPF